MNANVEPAADPIAERCAALVNACASDLGIPPIYQPLEFMKGTRSPIRAALYTYVRIAYVTALRETERYRERGEAVPASLASLVIPNKSEICTDAYFAMQMAEEVGESAFSKMARLRAELAKRGLSITFANPPTT